MACLCRPFPFCSQYCRRAQYWKKRVWGIQSHKVAAQSASIPFPPKPHLFMRDRGAHKRSSFHSYNSTPASWYTSPQYSKSPNNKGVTLQPRHSITHAHCMDAKRRMWWETQSVLAMLITAPSTKHHLHLYVYFLFSFSFFTVNQVPSKWLQTIFLRTRIRSHIWKLASCDSWMSSLFYCLIYSTDTEIWCPHF